MKIKRERPLSAAAMGCPPVPRAVRTKLNGMIREARRQEALAKKQGYDHLVFGWQCHGAALVKLRKWLKGSWAPAGNTELTGAQRSVE